MGKFFDFVVKISEQCYEARREQLKKMYSMYDNESDEMNPSKTITATRPIKKLETLTVKN